MRRLTLILVAGLLLPGCGEAARTASTDARVQLKLSAPDDRAVVRGEDAIEVRGTVTPADAVVQVAGVQAEVTGGEFVASVPLEPDWNVIDVTAAATGYRPTVDALRVQRDMRVQVPKTLVGLDVDTAKGALSQLGLRSLEERGGSWLDRVIPGTVTVCEANPAPGALVQPNTTVTLTTARDC